MNRLTWDTLTVKKGRRKDVLGTPAHTDSHTSLLSKHCAPAPVSCQRLYLHTLTFPIVFQRIYVHMYIFISSMERGYTDKQQYMIYP